MAGTLEGSKELKPQNAINFPYFVFVAEGRERLRGVTSHGAILAKVSLTPVRHETDMTRPGEAGRHAQSRGRWGGMLLGTANEARRAAPRGP
jgi:hypothetical protein